MRLKGRTGSGCFEGGLLYFTTMAMSKERYFENKDRREEREILLFELKTLLEIGDKLPLERRESARIRVKTILTDLCIVTV